MKKSKKPLQLNKETLRNVNDEQLETVAGGTGITNQPGRSACVCASKPGRCTGVGTDFCD